MRQFKIKATNVRIIMMVAITLTTILAVLSFYSVQKVLLKSALDKNTSIPVGESIQNNSPEQLIDNTALPEGISNKISALSVTKSDYQDQAIKDLNKYAALSQVTIENGFNFISTTPLSATDNFSLGHLSPEPVTITIANPVPLSNFLKFIKLIETNLPLMQLTGIDINRYQDSGTDIVTGPLTIEVLTR